MLSFFIDYLIHSPVYPHWLEFLNARRGTARVLRGIHGSVLEVGAGDGSRKMELIEKYPAIENYVSTDYSSWDEEFKNIDQKLKKNGLFQSVIWGHRKREMLDRVCSATDLPFEDNTFDYHLSFEVLEHIDDPFRYFSEAARVVKPGGKIVVVVPFLYRMHGGENNEHRMDHFRYAKGFFYHLSERLPIKVVGILCTAGFGTTLASMTNQFVVRAIVEGGLLSKLILIPLSPMVFLFMNCLGYVIDLSPDQRFATRFHVVLKKDEDIIATS